MSDKWVLALDGSTGVCSAALLRAAVEGSEGSAGGARMDSESWTVAAHRNEPDGKAQARVLLRLIDEMLHEVGQDTFSLDAVVVGTGPGTFTGVRITVATARALSLSLAVPVLGVSTLGALAAGGALGADTRAGVVVSPQILMPVIDARRQQVFYGVYRRNEMTDAGGRVASRQTWVRTQPFEVCDRSEFAERAVAEAEGLGADPAAGCAIQVIGESESLVPGLHSGVVFRQTQVHAEWLVRGQGRLVEPESLLGGDRLFNWLEGLRLAGKSELRSTQQSRAAGTPGTPEAVKPVYVRPPDADIHITKMRDPWASTKIER